MKVSFAEATVPGKMFFPRMSLYWHSDRQAMFDQPPPPPPHGLPAGPHGEPGVVAGNWPLSRGAELNAALRAADRASGW